MLQQMTPVKMIINKVIASAAFCILFRIQATVGILDEKPENTVVFFNHSATFKCKSSENRKLQWDYFGTGTAQEELYTGYSFKANACPCPSCCELEKPGEYNLKITARKETAKNYMCTEPGSLQKASASLIVIASMLNNTCKCMKTSDNVTLSCVIEYYGEWVPSINWSRSDGERVYDEDISVSDENGKVTSNLNTTMKLYNSGACDTTESGTSDTTESGTHYSTTPVPLPPDLVNFTASVYFSKTKRPADVTAKNVPSYPDQWNSPPFISDQPSKHSNSKRDGGSPDPDTPKTGDENGKIAGAVVCTSAVCAAAAGGGAYAYKKKKEGETKKGETPKTTENQPMVGEKEFVA